MTEYGPIEAYLERFGRRLGRSGVERDDIVAELRDHLAQAVERLEGQGLATRDAELLALARLGEAEFLAREYGGRRLRQRAGPIVAAAGAVALSLAVAAAALHPVGNDGDLARRLGLEPRGQQEPSSVEINGVPLPLGVSPVDDEVLQLRARLVILDE